MSMFSPPGYIDPYAQYALQQQRNKTRNNGPYVPPNYVNKVNPTNPILTMPGSYVDPNGTTHWPAQGGPQPVVTAPGALSDEPKVIPEEVPVAGNPILTQNNEEPKTPGVLAEPTHTMPDGTQMPGAEHPKTPGLPGYEMSFGEKMGRYGGNIMSAGSKGGMAQVGAMGTTVGEIKNIERDQTRMMREDELAREQANARKVPNAAALEKQAEIQNMYDTQVKYDQAIQDFIKYGDSVTGLLDSTVQSAKDSQGVFGGDPEREAFRYRIKDIIISDTLLQTAKTSGAISDKEMALFKSGVPKMTDQESVWIAWLTKRSAYLKQINQRISDGVQISATAEIGFTGYVPTSPSGQSATAPSALTQDQTDAMANNIK